VETYLEGERSSGVETNLEGERSEGVETNLEGERSNKKGVETNLKGESSNEGEELEGESSIKYLETNLPEFSDELKKKLQEKEAQQEHLERTIRGLEEILEGKTRSLEENVAQQEHLEHTIRGLEKTFEEKTKSRGKRCLTGAFATHHPWTRRDTGREN
jgi:chromosome segregation ATPase